jgi:hypothetical protein
MHFLYTCALLCCAISGPGWLVTRTVTWLRFCRIGMVLCEVAEDLTWNISNDIKSFFCFWIFFKKLYFIFLRMNSFETILMKLYYLVPTGTSPKLDIFEIQYNTIPVTKNSTNNFAANTWWDIWEDVISLCNNNSLEPTLITVLTLRLWTGIIVGHVCFDRTFQSEWIFTVGGGGTSNIEYHDGK